MTTAPRPRTTPLPTAQRIAQAERLEAEAFHDLYMAASARFAQTWGLKTARSSSQTRLALRELPASLFNRVLHTDADEPATENGVAQAVAWLRDHANPRWSVGIAPHMLHMQLAAWLENHGVHAKGGGMAKFWREPRQPELQVPGAFDVRKVGTERACEFGRVAQDGFGLPEGFAAWLGALAGRPRWHAYVAYRGATPAAVGAMFIDHGFAWLGVGATLAAHRGRGAQTALLGQRVRDAIAMGVEGLAVDTGNPEPGQAPGPSYRNIVRAGFVRSHVRPEYSA